MLTGQNLPVNSIAFLDRHRGWLVGAQGLILATRDGGKSWYSQRRHAPRLGVLAAVSQHAEIPWCPLAAAAWEEQVGAAVVVTAAEEPISRVGFQPNHSQLLSTLAPQVGLVELRTWGAAGESQASTTRRLAIEILCWRPDVVLTSEARQLPVFTPAPAALPISEALALAADAEKQLPLAAELGLASWQVQKLAIVTQPSAGRYSEQCRRVLRSPGLAIWDILLPLPSEARQLADTVPMRTLWSRSQATVVNASLFGGCARSPDNARQLSIGSLGNYQLVMGRVHRKNSLQALLEQPEGNPIAAWTKELNFVLDSFPVAEAAPALVTLAQQLSGVNWARQQAVLEILASRGQGSDAADWARITSLQLTSSDEFSTWMANAKQIPAAADAIDASSGPAVAWPRADHSSRLERIAL